MYIVKQHFGGLEHVRQISLTRGYMSAGEAVEHFGLGDAAGIERLEVRWPSGARTELRDLPAGKLLVVDEGGSWQAWSPGKPTGLARGR